MMKFLAILGIVILVVLIIYLAIKIAFIITIKRTLERYRVKLEVAIKSQNDLFEGLAEVLDQLAITHQLAEVIYPPTAFKNSTFMIQKVQLGKYAKAKAFIDSLNSKALLENNNYISLKTNLDAAWGEYVTFAGEYNRETKLFNRHLHMLSGRIIAFILQLRPRELL